MGAQLSLFDLHDHEPALDKPNTTLDLPAGNVINLFPVEKPEKKTQLCLDCQKREVTLVKDSERGIWVGKRLCKACTLTQKRQYLGAW